MDSHGGEAAETMLPLFEGYLDRPAEAVGLRWVRGGGVFEWVGIGVLGWPRGRRDGGLSSFCLPGCSEEAYDRVRLGAVVFLGTLAAHLDPGSPKVPLALLLLLLLLLAPLPLHPLPCQ